MSSKDAPLDPGPSLLQLPPEVRNMIYKYLFHRVEAKITWTCQNAHVGTESGIVRWGDPRLRHILATCRVVRAEALPVLYSQVRFLISITQRDPRFGIANFIGDIGNDASPSITKLSLHRGIHNPRKFNSRGLITDDPVDGSSILELIAGWVRHFPKLEELRLIYVEIKDHQYVMRTTMKKSLSRQALFLTRLKVFAEMKCVLAYNHRTRTYMQDNSGPRVYRLNLNGDALVLEPYDDRFSVRYRCW